MPQAPFHAQVIRDLVNMLQTYFRHRSDITIFQDLIMNWGIPGLPNPSPDVSVVPDVRDPDAVLYAGRFDVLAEGTRPVLVIEVVSPHYRVEDRQDKVEIYEQAGVLEYLIIDRVRRRNQIVNEVLGYRLVRGIYRPILADEDGFIYCQTVGLRFGLEEAQVVAEDVATGQRLYTLEDEVFIREAAESRADEAESRAQQLAAQVEAEAQKRLTLEARLAELEAALRRGQGDA